MAAKNEGEKDNIALFRKLTRLTMQVSMGNYTIAKNIFNLTKTDTYPKAITDLAEAFGMMIVKVESREFKLELLVDDLEKSCREMAAAKKALEGFKQTLERRVQDRTARWHQKNEELKGTLKLLKKEIKERKQAEKVQKELCEQLEEANRKLMDAYLCMRQRKDQLAARHYAESIVFLVDDDGHICGVTEKAMNMTNKSRSYLHNANIQDFLEPREGQGQTLKDIMRQAHPKMPHLTNLQLKSAGSRQISYEAKLTRVSVDKKRLISIVLYEQVV